MSCELLNLLRCSNPSSGPKFARAKPSNYFNINLKVKAKTVVRLRLTLGLLEACFQVLRVSCELLNLLRCSNPSSGPKFARAKPSNYFNINLKVKAKTVVRLRLTLGLLEACFQVLRVSCELLNLLRCSNPSSGPKFARAKLARFLGRSLLPARGPRARAPPRGWWPSGRASVSEAGGPGLGSSLARALFCVTPLWFRAAGRRFSCPCRGFPLLGENMALTHSRD